MKTKPELPRRRWLALLAALPWSARAAASPFDLPELMALLARRKSGEAKFSEQRFVSGFDAPLRSSGVLSFAAPDRMERRTLEPRPESMRVEGNQVTLTRGGRTRQLTLDAAGELLGVIEAMRGTLTGNAESLQRHFRAAVSGDAQRWRLELTPIDAALSAVLRAARIAGEQSEVRSVELELAGGDRSLMAIEPLRAPAAGR